jgi:hypothetical protein
MQQILLSSEKIERINDIKKDEELCLFDNVKRANQTNDRCKRIREVIIQNKKNFDEMLLKKFKIKENILFFRDKL